MTDALILLNQIEQHLLEAAGFDGCELQQLLTQLHEHLQSGPGLALLNVLHSLISALPLAGQQSRLIKTIALTVIAELQALIAASPASV